MKIQISGGDSVELNIGDKVDSRYSIAKAATVIGFREHDFAYTHSELSMDAPCINEESERAGISYRAKYNIGPEWPDSTQFYGTAFRNITAVYTKHCTLKEAKAGTPTQDIDRSAQARSAAWGKDKHEAPEGAAFEFL